MPRRKPNEHVELIDALRLSPSDSEAIVNELDRTAHASGREKRRNKRLSYRSIGGLILQVTHPGGTTARFLVKPRNLSSTGLSVLHGGFIHPGTACVLPLKDLQGHAARVDGEVVACRLIRGRVHELGIAFKRSIALDAYVLDAEPEITGPVTVPQLKGRVLVVDEWLDDRQLLAYDLQKLGLETTEADGAAEVLRSVHGQRWDAIVAGEWLGDMSAAGLAGALRDRGCTVPLIGVISSDAAAGAAPAEAECAAVLQKPYRLEALAGALLQFLTISADVEEGDPAASDLSARWIEPAMRPMILAFLQGLEIRLGELERQVREVEAEPDPAQACLRLKTTAASYGFPGIGDAANELAALLANHAPLDQVKASLDELSALASIALYVAEREIKAS